MYNEDVYYKPLTKLLLFLSPIILFGIAASSFWVAVTFRQSGILLSIMFAAIGIWFLRVGYFSVQGLRFINIRICIHDWGLEVQGIPQSRSIRWSEVSRVTRNPNVQALSVKDQSGSIVFLVDYQISGFTRLDAALKESGHP